MDEQLIFTVGPQVFARHVTWMVLPGRAPMASLELRAVVSGSGDGPEDPCIVRPGLVRIVPDAPEMRVPVLQPVAGACELEALDLEEACAKGCGGGATVLVYSDVADPNLRVPVRLLISLRGAIGMGAQPPGQDGGWSLRLTKTPVPGEELATRVEPDAVEGVMDIFPSSPDVISHAVLRVSADAIREPITRLHGTMRLGIRHVDGGDVAGASQRITVGSLEPFSVVPHIPYLEVDWLAHCQAEVVCEIPITFEARTAGDVPSGAELEPAFYRWVVEPSLDALDGRKLPPAPFSIEVR